MIIKRMTATFGKLDNQRIDLTEGLNVITAPNESGKSTWTAFLRAMLYGIDTRERDKKGHLADKTRYEPWSGAPMQGELITEIDGQEIAIRRDSIGGVPFGTFEAVYTATGEKVPYLTAETCGVTLVGAEREVYERSAFVGQSGSAVTPAPELERRIVALATTGEEGSSFSEVIDRLRKWQRRRKYNKTGIIPDLEQKIQHIDDKLNAIAQLSHQQEDIAKRVDKLKAEFSTLKDEQQMHTRIAQRSLNKKYGETTAELSQIERKLDELSAKAHTFDKAMLLQTQEKMAFISALEETVSDCTFATEKAKEALSLAQEDNPESIFVDMTEQEALAFARSECAVIEKATQKRDGAKRAATSVFITFLAAAIAAAAGGMFLNPLWYYLAGGAGALGLILTIILRIRASSLRKKCDLLLSKYFVTTPEDILTIAQEHCQRQQSLQTLERDYAQAQSLLERAQDRLARGTSDVLDAVHIFAPEVSDLTQVPAALSRISGYNDEFNILSAKADAVRRLSAQLEEQGARAIDTLEFIQPPQRTPEETAKAIAAVQAEISRSEQDFAQLSGQIQAIGVISELEEQKKDLSYLLTQRQMQYDALGVAIDALTRAFHKLQERFSPELNHLASRYFSKLTGGRYQELSLTREFEASTLETGAILPRSALYLSQGTLDQLYLAVRLAIANLCLPQDSTVPIVLDDALCAFDTVRMQRALNLLEELANQRQIILFTCHNREREFLASNHQVNCIGRD